MLFLDYSLSSLTRLALILKDLIDWEKVDGNAKYLEYHWLSSKIHPGLILAFCSPGN